jgi:hypothetical protein
LAAEACCSLLESTGHAHLPQVIYREWGRGERKREGGGRTLSSAWLLLCSTARVHRPAAPSEEPPLHLCLVICTCRGAAPASPSLQASAIRICASAVTACLRRPSAFPQLPVRLVSQPPPAVCCPPGVPLPPLCSSLFRLVCPCLLSVPSAWYGLAWYLVPGIPSLL